MSEAEKATLQSSSAFSRVFRRAYRIRGPHSFFIGMLIILLMSVAAIFAGAIAPYQPDAVDPLNALMAPSLQHYFGTDEVGRDVFSRVVFGLRVDITFGLLTTYVAMAIGTIVGLIAGYFGGWFDSVVNAIIDIVIAVPFVVLVLAIVAVTGKGLLGVYVAAIGVSWALYARVTRTQMLVLRELPYMQAAWLLGYSTPRILFRHALPNLVRSNLVFSMSDVVLNILLLASLSFLGLGVQPPMSELGGIVATGQTFLLNAWWISSLPGLVIVVVGVGFSLLGDSVARMLDGERP